MYLGEGFDLSRDDLAKSLNSAVKYNNGFFKSEKQAKFLMDAWKGIFQTDKDELKKNYNVEIFGKEVAVDVTQTLHFGVATTQLVTWIFVLDSSGVVRKYKLKRHNNKVDPTATKKEFERDNKIEKPEWATDDALSASKKEAMRKHLEHLVKLHSQVHVGEAGEVIKDLKLIGSHLIDRGYDRYDNRDVTSVFKTENGDLIYWGSVPKNIDESQFAGMEFKLIKATVKENGFNKKQEPYTKILRPKFE